MTSEEKIKSWCEKQPGYSDDPKQHIKWEIEAIERISKIAKETINDQTTLQSLLKKHNKEIKELEHKLKSL